MKLYCIIILIIILIKYGIKCSKFKKCFKMFKNRNDYFWYNMYMKLAFELYMCLNHPFEVERNSITS